MALSPNYDYDTEAADIARRQKIADALQTGSLAPIDFQAAPGVSTANASMFAGLQKVIQAVMASRQHDQIKSDQTELKNRYGADLRTGMSNLMGGLNTQAGTTAPAVQGNNPSAYVPAQTVSPQDAQVAQQNAVLNAIASNHPVLQQLGMSYMNKNQLTAKDLLDAKGFDPATQVAAIRGGGVGVLKPAQKIMATNDQLIRTDESGNAATVPGGDLRTKFGPLAQVGTGPSGEAIQGQKADTGELKFPPPGTNINLNTQTTAAEAAAQALGKINIDQLDKSYQTAKDLPATMQTLTQAHSALDAGIKSGIGSDAGMLASQVGEALGLGQTDPTVANTQQFRANMASKVLDSIKILRPASDNDVKYAKAAAGADTSLALPALQKLVENAQAVTANAWLNHQRLVDQSKDLPGMNEAGRKMLYGPNMDIHLPADKFDYQGGQFIPRGTAGGTDRVAKPTVSNWPGQ